MNILHFSSFFMHLAIPALVGGQGTPYPAHGVARAAVSRGTGAPNGRAYYPWRQRRAALWASPLRGDALAQVRATTDLG
jgi:hypothetical protein